MPTYNHPSSRDYRDAFLSLSASPYSFLMISKEMIEAKSQMRLLQSRQATMNLMMNSKSQKAYKTQEKDSMHSFSSSTTSATSLLRTQSESKATSSSTTSAGSLHFLPHGATITNEHKGRIKSSYKTDISRDTAVDLSQTSTNARNIRRATYNKTVIDDLCNIIADLSIAESKLLAAQSNVTRDLSSSSLADLIDPSRLQNSVDCNESRFQSDEVGKWRTNSKSPDAQRKRDIVIREVRDFLENFPMRYSFSIQSPSEVLVHMRLVGVARSDEYRAAVHIVKVEKRQIKDRCDNPLESNSNLRLVTISCSDRDGLLEYISKLLSSCGSRVLDADVMTTKDNIALVSFSFLSRMM